MARRYYELDALRGIAALIVVLRHYANVYRADDGGLFFRSLLKTPFRLLFAAHEAVLLFFLLSGFVLALSLSRRKTSYPLFVMRRVTRVWLPYVAALAIATLAAMFFSSVVPMTSDWFSQTWNRPPTASLIAQHVMLIGKFEVVRLNTAFWSLVYEMRISLIFPIVLLLARGTLGNVAGTCALAALASWLSQSSEFRADWIVTLHLAGIFAVGAWIALRVDDILVRWHSIASNLRVAVTAGAVLLVMYAGALRPIVGPFADWLIIAGIAWLMISALAYQPVTHLLERPVLQYLGQISYSLYLIHGTVLFALIHMLAAKTGLYLILPVYLLVTFAVAHCFHRLVETPAIALTARIGRRKIGSSWLS